MAESRVGFQGREHRWPGHTQCSRERGCRRYPSTRRHHAHRPLLQAECGHGIKLGPAGEVQAPESGNGGTVYPQNLAMVRRSFPATCFPSAFSFDELTGPVPKPTLSFMGDVAGWCLWYAHHHMRHCPTLLLPCTLYCCTMQAATFDDELIHHMAEQVRPGQKGATQAGDAACMLCSGSQWGLGCEWACRLRIQSLSHPAGMLCPTCCG